MNDAATPPLAVQGLSGGYGDTRILRGLSLQVQAGQVLAVLGRNGVGKTTLMRMLTGLARQFDGELRFKGVDLRALRTHARQRLGISRKYLIPLLEWADGKGLTVRVGDVRRLRITGKSP